MIIRSKKLKVKVEQKTDDISIAQLTRNIVLASCLTRRRILCKFDIKQASRRYATWLASLNIPECLDCSCEDTDCK